MDIKEIIEDAKVAGFITHNECIYAGQVELTECLTKLVELTLKRASLFTNEQDAWISVDDRRDTERLDFLDKMNARKNKQCGTTYGWLLEENHNRIAISDHNCPYKTIRQAIDQAIANRKGGV